MSFNKRLGAIVFLIIIFLILITFCNKIEKFVSECNLNSFIGENVEQAGYFSVVKSDDINEPEIYDHDKMGPTCIAKCIMEHGVNINFKNPLQETDMFVWHKQPQNIGRGYCFNANDDVFPYNCSSDNCQNKCERNNNSIDDKYLPEEDFTQCKKDEKYGCIEDEKLNFLTGVAAQTTTGCKKCIQKYMPNLTSMLNILDDQMESDEKCDVD